MKRLDLNKEKIDACEDPVQMQSWILDIKEHRISIDAYLLKMEESNLSLTLPATKAQAFRRVLGYLEYRANLKLRSLKPKPLRQLSYSGCFMLAARKALSYEKYLEVIALTKLVHASFMNGTSKEEYGIDADNRKVQSAPADGWEYSDDVPFQRES